ncbi:hypothetical protein [Paraclostridium bifermentans]|uniref:hypothetical protein n=1 Tax=Paraclostridium bifermentans TaxID=1490 RepID=UPI00374EEE5D
MDEVLGKVKLTDRLGPLSINLLFWLTLIGEQLCGVLNFKLLYSVLDGINFVVAIFIVGYFFFGYKIKYKR